MDIVKKDVVKLLVLRADDAERRSSLKQMIGYGNL